MRTSVEPCETALQGLYEQFFLFQVFLVDRRDLQFSAGTGLDVLRNLYDTVGIEIESYHSVVGLWVLRLFLDAQTVAVLVEFCHTVALWVVHIVSEDGSPIVLFCMDDSLLQHTCEAATVEDVVAKYQTGTVVADELFTDDEGLSQSVGGGLFCIFEAHAEIAAVAQQTLETW